MLRAVFTLVLIVAAISIAFTPRGLAVLGSGRQVLVGALVILGILQAYRLIGAKQAKQRDDLMKKVPKRPLGI